MGSANGKRVQHKARATSEDGAKKALEKLRRDYGPAGDVAAMTLGAYLADWLTDYRPNIRASTFRSYKGHVDHHIVPLLGGIVISRLEPSDVRRLIRQTLAAGKSPATVARIIATLRIALGQAKNERAIADNVASGIRLPKVEREPVRGMTPAHANLIRDAIKGKPFEAVYRLLLGSGIRLGEAIGLNQRDVHVDDAYIEVRVSKTKVRAVPISDDAADALRTHLASLKVVGPDEPVFFGPKSGERLTGSTVSHALPRLLTEANLPRMTPHGLRHGTATLMLAAGVPMRVISEQLGHANPTMTAKVYAHVVPDMQRAAIRSVDRVRPSDESRNESQQ